MRRRMSVTDVAGTHGLSRRTMRVAGEGEKIAKMA